MTKTGETSNCACNPSIASKTSKTSIKSNRSLKGKGKGKKDAVPKEPFFKPGCEFMDHYHENKICFIPPTSPPKQNAFDAFRPPSRTVLDYDIQQTFTKLERMGPDGVQKFHIRNTVATYIPYPPGMAPVKRVKKELPLKHFNGGPPCCEYLDEIWRRKVEKKQEIARARLELFIENRKKRDIEDRKRKILKKRREEERLKELRRRNQ